MITSSIDDLLASLTFNDRDRDHAHRFFEGGSYSMDDTDRESGRCFEQYIKKGGPRPKYQFPHPHPHPHLHFKPSSTPKGSFTDLED